jgi:hypothetical protein
LSGEDASTRESGRRAANSRRGALDIEIDDRQMVGAQPQQRVADGRAGTACTDEYHVVGGGDRQALTESECESCGVGVVSDGARAIEDDRVDGAQLGRDVVDVIEMLDDQSLAWMGDVQRVEAEGAGPVEHLADAFGCDAGLGEIDRAIDVVEALRAGLGHMQRGGERRADTGPNEADEIRGHLLRLRNVRTSTYVKWSTVIRVASRGQCDRDPEGERE